MLCFLATRIFTDGHCNSEFGGMDCAEEVDVLKREIGVNALPLKTTDIAPINISLGTLAFTF
jgi:hypothetical protein